MFAVSLLHSCNDLPRYSSRRLRHSPAVGRAAGSFLRHSEARLRIKSTSSSPIARRRFFFSSLTSCWHMIPKPYMSELIP